MSGSAKWRLENPDRVREINRASMARLYPLYMKKLAALKIHPCADCGGVFPPECMQFDHIPGRGRKLFEINAVNIRRRWTAIHNEILKCDLVCANCHAIRTKRRKNANIQIPL